jgi:hypothetical protein
METKDQEILKKIDKLRSDYQLEVEEDHQEESLSFLDEMNGLIKSIFNDESISIYTVFSKENLEKWKQKRFSRWLKNIVFKNTKNFLYFVLLSTITLFLVSEAVDFYAVDGAISPKTYLKAILTEVCFIFLAGYRSNTKMQMLGVSILRFGIFCLMLFAITSKTFMDSTKYAGNTNAIQEQITIIEEQIKEKDKSITYYKEKNWPLTTKQLIEDKQKLVNKIIDLKQQQAEGANKDTSKLVTYQSYGRAFFRVLLLFISMLITRRIFTF